MKYERGFRLSGGILGFDCPDAGLFFVSSPETPAGGAWRARKPLCTDLTARLLRAVRREFRPLVMPYGRPTDIGSLRVTLLPSGPMPGAAAIVVENKGARLLYTSGAIADLTTLPQCDTLAAQVSFPGDSDAIPAMVASAKSALASGMTPVILANPFGAAFAACQGLSKAGIPVRQHRGIYRFNQVWKSVGGEMGMCRRFNGALPSPAAVIIPVHLFNSAFLARVPNPWVILLARSSQEQFAGSFDQRIVLPGLVSAGHAVAIADACGAGQVLLSGDGAPGAAEMMHGRDVNVMDLVVQCSLPLP